MSALDKAWQKYCALFDAEKWREAASAYADYLLLKAKTKSQNKKPKQNERKRKSFFRQQPR